MEKNTEFLRMAVDMFDWHTKLYINSLDAIEKKDVQNRLGTKANHIAWIAGSIMNERYVLASFFKIGLQSTSPELFTDHRGIVDDVTYPSLEEYVQDWKKLKPMLREALMNATEEDLCRPDPWEMPGGPYTFRDTILACLDRESYCIGQLGLWRRLLGYPAMKYE